MTDKAIECKGLSKRYQLSHRERYSALRDRLSPSYWLKHLVDRQPKNTEEFWALKDVTFDVAPGEAVGIIGRNGAGKSTLLKVLSRITSPTSGEARIHGRVASLLEVGTGFHPELSGRENIYLNGAILGMRRADITRKFDAIVDFSGVEKFIDTPVKRYSSGMYVRLAFAVAAYLEPEILVVDEVLAVGDADFQAKCLGKMKEVGKEEGRTILFVSHNMTAIESLCRRALWMNGGMVVDEGDSARVVAAYLNRHGTQVLEKEWPDPATAPGNDRVRFRRVRVVPEGPEPTHFTVRTPFRVETEFWNQIEGGRLNVTLSFGTLAGECIFAIGGGNGSYARGLHRVSCAVPGDLLNDGLITISALIVEDSSRLLHRLDDALTIQVDDTPRDGAWLDKWPGAVRPTFLRWSTERIDDARPNGGKPETPRLVPEKETRA
jgi:lipopolysaccharide transport system ATP-binding protein